MNNETTKKPEARATAPGAKAEPAATQTTSSAEASKPQQSAPVNKAPIAQSGKPENNHQGKNPNGCAQNGPATNATAQRDAAIANALMRQRLRYRLEHRPNGGSEIRNGAQDDSGSSLEADPTKTPTPHAISASAEGGCPDKPHRTLETILGNLEAALVRRKGKTPSITDEQRVALAEECEKMLGAISESELVLLLRPIRDTGLYLAVAGNFREFCEVFLQLDADHVNGLLDGPGKDDTATALTPAKGPPARRTRKADPCSTSPPGEAKPGPDAPDNSLAHAIQAGEPARPSGKREDDTTINSGSETASSPQATRSTPHNVATDPMPLSPAEPRSHAALLTELHKLHDEILGAAKMTLENAIRSGEILVGFKKEVGRGNWLRWLKDNVRFTERTARNYIRVFERRTELKSETVSDLTQAYRWLTEPRDATEPTETTEANEATKDAQSTVTKQNESHQSRNTKGKSAKKTSSQQKTSRGVQKPMGAETGAPIQAEVPAGAAEVPAIEATSQADPKQLIEDIADNVRFLVEKCRSALDAYPRGHTRLKAVLKSFITQMERVFKKAEMSVGR